MTETTKGGCEQLCPKYRVCEKMVQTGLASSVLAGSRTSSVQYEAEDGSSISSAEFWGTAGLSDTEIDHYEQMGRSMQDGGRGLQKALLEGCSAGQPLGAGRDEAGEKLYICQSTNKSAVDFTEADLQ